tara:strand:+ start:157 stop:834 length:678 start_codon:yes stop_codon:yes gene_type:complete
MIYNIPGSIVISYLGGTFGNALASLINSSRSRVIKYPTGNTFHVVNWPIDPIDCTILKDKPVRFTKKVAENDIMQLHCLNAELIHYKFPASKIILLTCNQYDEYYGIQRQWLVNTNPIGITVKNILSAWDWIEYNLNYYSISRRELSSDNAVCLDFKSVVDNFKKIENYLELTLLDKAKNIYINHYNNQMKTFYNHNPNFNFAWEKFNTTGHSAPIKDLAIEFLQ